ncbi:hypothetical protein DFA_04503 [Cavenderia fasciculata]|uniref:Uncharacterized protein n=1 Tax=Cavenderia fasciculata TaxID=261658 RepID=F4PPS2_CACFS|nr:uncharacterized protein DFA_04503 [Cavenderia fasciculata]EGG22385.1 hypothetical protein DFA_04503 [Cavenderia fasciculata]|eukprot:XP_004360236.1 hypothetical protein DFA_04503 [Cavenderia fasciculata]
MGDHQMGEVRDQQTRIIVDCINDTREFREELLPKPSLQEIMKEISKISTLQDNMNKDQEAIKQQINKLCESQEKMSKAQEAIKQQMNCQPILFPQKQS